MGYSNYIWIVETEKLKKYKHVADTDMDIVRGILDGKMVYDLGKYSEIGSEKENLPFNSLDNPELVKLKENQGEFGFNILTREDIKDIILYYKDKTISLLRDLLKEKSADIREKRSSGERCILEVKSELKWLTGFGDIYRDGEDSLNFDEDYELINSWLYKHAMFNLLHIYKTVDWNKYTPVITGG